eukprot:TRINITY_DN547_c0_g1_i4.p1 TRINITY_DN547_c0_g1~~TRINITY_DN547_c0_g1_i4.p1  ORF type:complete len:384 (-),score=57.32 TRINITY_DN547_c0_g1_i4:430-1581(-)
MAETAEERIQRNKDWLHQRGIRLPTLQQMRDPSLIPDDVKKQLKDIALQDVSPLNLYRISWKNEPVAKGGGFAGVNHIVLPPSLTGVPCRIVVLIGAHFPTGAHKVGATYCSLADKITSGVLDPVRHKVLWPSTGNYCRGGVYDCQLLECPSIAVLPEDMSQERFDWLKAHDAQIEPTPGGESNVKEIFDHVKAMTACDDSILVCNQFAEFGNPMWHYAVTGPAMQEVFESLPGDNNRLSGVFSCTGSAGTIACGDYLKHQFPGIKVAAGEALQCPTLTYGGYGEHRIEGIGDKIVSNHLPIYLVPCHEIGICTDCAHVSSPVLSRSPGCITSATWMWPAPWMTSMWSVSTASSTQKQVSVLLLPMVYLQTLSPNSITLVSRV